MHGLCTMHNVHNDHNALEATCWYTTNASYTLIHHVPMQFNQAKCLSMHEHVLKDARCMSLWLECKENASVCMLCMKILTLTPITLQKSDSQQRIQTWRFENQNLHEVCK